MNSPLPKHSWLERLSTLLSREPEDREQLIELLHSAFERNLLDSDALSMIEGVMQVSEMQASDIMVPRSQMDVIDISETPDKFVPLMIETAHSRFPVTENMSTLLSREPEDREQLIELLHSAFERNLLDSDALSMIEGVMQVSEMQASDIMVPRSQMDVIDISETPDKFVPLMIETNLSGVSLMSITSICEQSLT